MKTKYFKKILAAGLAAISVMSASAAANVTANADYVLSGGSNHYNISYAGNSTGFVVGKNAAAVSYNGEASDVTVVTVGEEVESIADTAFNNLPNVTRFEVATGNTHFKTIENGKYLTTYFENDSDTKFIVHAAPKGANPENIPANVHGIGAYAFYGVFQNLSSLTLDKDVAVIGSHAFEGCQIENIRLGAKVREIGSSAFAGNKSVTVLELSENINLIDSEAFSGCDNLRTVRYDNPIMLFSGAFPAGVETIATEKALSREIIVFDIEDGDIAKWPDNIRFDKGVNPSVATAVLPEKSNEIFDCWRDKNGNRIEAGGNLGHTVSTYLTAVYTIGYTIILDANGGIFTDGSKVKTLKAAPGKLFTILENARRNHTTSRYWVTGEGERVDVSFYPEKNMHLYADYGYGEIIDSGTGAYVVDDPIDTIDHTFDNTVIKAMPKATIDYKSDVTIKAYVENLPSGYRFVITDGNKILEEGIDGEINFHVGKMTSSKTYYVRIIDNSESVKRSQAIEINVKTGFFDIIAAFFRDLFRGQTAYVVKPGK